MDFLKKDSWLNANWDWLEPIFGMFSFIVELIAVMSLFLYFYKVYRAKKQRYAQREGDGIVWLIIQINAPVVNCFKEQFKVVPDYLIDSKTILGHSVIFGDNDYKKISKKFKEVLTSNQHKEIRIVTSGMAGLNGLLGQMVGPSYDVVWYQFDMQEKKYHPLPTLAGLM